MRTQYQELHTLSQGPNSNTMLFLQCDHCSTLIWEGTDPGVLGAVHHYHMQVWTLNEWVRHYVCRASLYCLWHCDNECRPCFSDTTCKVMGQEMRTFHLPVDEVSPCWWLCRT